MVLKSPLNEPDAKLIAALGKGSLPECLNTVMALYKFSTGLQLALATDEVFYEIDHLLRTHLGVEDYCIFLLDGRRENLIAQNGDTSCPENIKNLSLRLGEGITGKAAVTGETMLARDVSSAESPPPYGKEGGGIGALLAIPLKKQDGTVIGVFNVHRKEPDSFGETDVVMLEVAATHISTAIEKSEVFMETQKQAITDQLTQLFTRRYFMNALDREISNAERYQNYFALLMLDVDHFKDINDTYGHQAGDVVLEKLGKIIRSYTRKGDIAARYGGEEFLLLLIGVTKKSAAALAEKLRSLVEKNLRFEADGGKKRAVTVSIGVASYPECGRSAEALISYADKALYNAKAMGRNRVWTFQEERAPDVRDRRKSERFDVAIRKLLPGSNGIQYIDINVKGKWMPCIVKDICNDGFKGIVDFRPSKNVVYQGKIVANGNTILPGIIPMRCVNHMDMGNEKHYISIEIVDNHDNWARHFEMVMGL